MIIEGEAEVRVAVDGMTEKVATLRGGDYFGEMGLLAGEPRSSTVLARTDVKCYRLGKEALEAILRRRPEVAEQISETLARRRVELDAVREEANEEALREHMKKNKLSFCGASASSSGLAAMQLEEKVEPLNGFDFVTSQLS